MPDSLGVPAHPGGLVVDRPELSVGVVNAISRPSGLELELLARRPLDRRRPAQRQDDIRAGRGGPVSAPRRLLPRYDEGLDLRAGWLDRDGRAHWEFASSSSSSSGDHFAGVNGPSLRAVFDFPPLFDRASLVLAWPEIGFPETVVELPLPDRATVERDTVSIWAAPVAARPVPGSLTHRVGPFPAEEPMVEAGRLAARARVLNRSADAVVVLTRLTAADAALSMEVLSVARHEWAHTATIAADSRGGISEDPERVRADGPGASFAVLHDREARWLRRDGGTSSGDRRSFRSTMEFTTGRPGDGVLTLLVAWPAAGLPDVCVDVAVSSDR